MKLKKTPLKGKPYFGNISESNLSNCEELIQSLIFSYKNADDKQTVEVLQKCLKDISDTITEEIYNQESTLPKEVSENPFQKKRFKKRKMCLTSKK